MRFHKNLTEMIESEITKLKTLQAFPETGIILKIYRETGKQGEGYSVTKEVEELQLDIYGILADRHRRPHRPRTGREKTLYPKGSSLKENRNWFAVSPLDIERCTQQMNLKITPEMLGANFLIGAEDGRPYLLSQLPRGTYMLIAHPESIDPPKPPLATLVVHAQQSPCVVTGGAISAIYNQDLTAKFIEETKPNRGIAGNIEYPVHEPATIRPGHKVFFKFPIGIED